MAAAGDADALPGRPPWLFIPTASVYKHRVDMLLRVLQNPVSSNRQKMESVGECVEDWEWEDSDINKLSWAKRQRVGPPDSLGDLSGVASVIRPGEPPASGPASLSPPSVSHATGAAASSFGSTQLSPEQISVIAQRKEAALARRDDRQALGESVQNASGCQWS